MEIMMSRSIRLSLLKLMLAFMGLIVAGCVPTSSVVLNTAQHSTIDAAADDMRLSIALAESRQCKIESVDLGVGHGVGHGRGIGIGVGVGIGLKVGSDCPECDASKINLERTKKVEKRTDKTVSQTKIFMVAHAKCPRNMTVQ